MAVAKHPRKNANIRFHQTPCAPVRNYRNQQNSQRRQSMASAQTSSKPTPITPTPHSQHGPSSLYAPHHSTLVPSSSSLHSCSTPSSIPKQPACYSAPVYSSHSILYRHGRNFVDVVKCFTRYSTFITI